MAAVLVLRLCLKRAPKWWNVLLWGVDAARLLLPFSIKSTLSLLPRAALLRPASLAAPVQSAGSEVGSVIGGSAAVSSGAAAGSLPGWIPVLAWVWLAGVLALCLYAALSALRVQHSVREAVILRENIYQSEYIASPFVLGILRPKIYLPYRLDRCEQGHVIAHEKAHLCRGDHLWKPLGFLLLSIYWFNPLMWLSYTLLCRDIELACDEKVIRELGCAQRADYMQALVSCSVNRRGIAACPLAFGEIGVKERVKSVMNYKKPTFWVILLAVVACIVLAVCFLTDPVSAKPAQTPDADVSVAGNAAAPDVPSAPGDSSGADAELPTQGDAPEETPDASISYDPQLDAAIGKAVLDHYADAAQAGQIHVESHVLLATDPNAADSSTEQVTAYLLVLQETYSADGETLTQENGSYIPTAITFARDSSGGYALEEYWEPSDGSYSEDIQSKFPGSAADEALNDQAYIEELEKACYQKATEILNGASN